MSHQTTADSGVLSPELATGDDRNPNSPTVGAHTADLRESDRPFDLEERRCEYVCASGDRFGGRWRGIPIPELIATSEIDPDATHLLVESDDGFRVCVAISDALGGILALERLDGTDELPRLIAPRIDGTRTIKRVRRIEGRRLAPEDDREDIERITISDSEGSDD